ncbi:endonuclease MutS2 [Secundilactobacillus paracollinoides]|uniref:Endonuclease MutS2 n=1 Tax=Secundilactobacillus paracollinoides TaxID=240427 RepID=A0A1B2J1T2_9LACO|nr:endonuclease MutS2 [Secundilactobacillus paracollinoides]ANZ62295.1 DNA mismatch repair protein MutS [Secundilactobacillus paracollinoides]ANZ68243.1 DNA mismatch repair protein MutS [Secundilactobacillus paracollinoides]
MNDKIFKTMAFDQIKQQLRAHLVSASGESELNHLMPVADQETVQRAIDETKDGADVLRLEGGIPLPKMADVTPHVKRLAIEGTLSGTELAQIGQVLKTVSRVVDFFDGLQDKALELRRLYAIVAELVHLPDVTRRLSMSVTDDGRLTDEASPELKRIRRRITQIEGSVRSQMNGYTRGKQAKYLSETLVTIRDDRYVLPFKAEYKNHFGGIVHDQSASGLTLYIEPEAVVSENNRLREAQIAERQEERRILLELSNLLRPYQDDISANATVLGHLDFINAKARYAHEIKATEPLLSAENHVNLRQARHPLIDQKKVVANDIEIGGDYKAIVVTGPNTGGKTITLKTLGLTQLMAQSGLFIPANENSQVGLFDEVFADIGDEQSIEQNLSTFSSHMDNIAAILKAATDHSLILLDEVGAGTDPQEGAALAMAILDNVGTIGSEVIATTHYPELKAYGYNRPETINASMEFDQETLKPTYHLLIGIPGRSNALEIAQRLGLDQSIIDEARGLTDQDSQDLNQMIASLTEQTRQANVDAAAAADKLHENEALYADLQKQFDAYQKQKSQLMEDAKRHANEVVDQTKKQADKIIKDIRKKQLASGKTVIKEDQLIDAQGSINALHQDETLTQNRVLNREKRKHQLKKGDEVLVKSYGQRGVIMDKLDDHNYEVQMGILKMKIDDSDLEKAAPEATTKKAPKATIRRTRSDGMTPTLDLRGHRYEEAMAEMDRYIDSALLAGYPSVTIIHGKGTGALRQGVIDYLKSNRRVKSFGFSPANAGGDGSTIVKL